MSSQSSLFAISTSNTHRSAIQKAQMIEFLRDKLTGLGTRASSQAYAQVKSQDNYGLDCPQCGHRIVQEELDMQSTTPKAIPLRQAALWFTFLASLIALIGGFYYVGWQSALNQVQSNHLKSDIVFPDGEERRQFSNSRARGSSFTDGKLNTVPMKKVRWISDKRFMTTDPYTGRFWSNKEGEWTAWDEIHRGSWIQLTPSPADEITGGLPLDLYSANGSWPNGKEGYVPSVLHQLHCVGTLNHWKLIMRGGETLSDSDLEHMGHCVEYLRHAVMCFGDTALEKPVDHSNFVHVETEGTTHLCRDWTALSQHFWASSIDFIWGTDAPMTVFENVDARGDYVAE